MPSFLMGKHMEIGPAGKSFDRTGKEEGLLCIALELGRQSQNGVPGTEGQGQRQVSRMSHYQVCWRSVSVASSRGRSALGHGKYPLSAPVYPGHQVQQRSGHGPGHGSEWAWQPHRARERSLDSSWQRPECRLEVKLLAGPRPRGRQGVKDLINQRAQLG